MAERGGWLLLLFMFCLTSYDLGRPSFHSEEKPALSASEQRGIQILLVDNEGRLDGIHQINDAKQLANVINLAGLRIPDYLRPDLLEPGVVSGGKTIKLQIVDDVVVSLEAGFMPAALRITLGIPLDVSQMSGVDWDDLPGVGTSLALRIESDRQKNGEFGSVDGLKRVKGVGSKRINKWRRFFVKAK